MQKILLAIDGVSIDLNTLNFACYIGRLTKSKITGVFLENLTAESRPVLKSNYTLPHLEWELDETADEHKQKIETIEKNIAYFKEACQSRGVSCDVHRDIGIPEKEMIAETRFADLLILDPETSFNNRNEGVLTGFVKDILKHAECPVIIAPESFETIEEIIFAYDGSASSAFAIKQFGYLFEELNQKRAIILEVNAENELTVDKKEQLTEWLGFHYADVSFKVLKGDAHDQLFTFLLLKKNAMVVMGAYGRNMMSNLFRKSTAERVLKTTNLPVFIAHH